jgi:hypothetical protein
MDQWQNDTNRGKPKYRKKNLSQKPNKDFYGIESGAPT